MIFETGYDELGEFGDSGQGNIPPDLRSSDLPSKRLLGKGLASIGYETEWRGVRYARKDFVAVPSHIFLQEAGVLLDLPDHDNVVKTHGLTVDKLSCSLVLDYMDDKLTDLLQKRKDLREGSPSGEHGSTLEESLGLILQIARAMEHLHNHGILHGDLKSRNILVTYTNDGDKSLSVKSVKVSDFGLVQTKRSSMPHVSHQARKLDMVRWKAPENLAELRREAASPDPDSDSDEDFTKSVCVTHGDDAYCFGLTCFQILTGEEPYPKRNWKELVVDIVSSKCGLRLHPNFSSCPQYLRELLELCCDVDPQKRPTFFYIRKKFEHMHSLRPWIVEEKRTRLEKASTPEQFLELTKACKDRVQGMLTPSEDVFVSLRVNYEQCKYLAEKLELAVEEAQMFLKHLQGSSIPQGEKTNCLNEFKLLYNVAHAVENSIQNCCKDAWVEAAFMMPNMSQDVLAISFDLALLAAFFSGNSLIEVDSVYRAEASIVTETAAIDRHVLLRDVNALLRTKARIIAEYQLAELLLEKLADPERNVAGSLSEAHRTDIESLKEEHCLGRGDYATVYKSVWLGIDVAVKSYHGPSSQEFRKEVSILGRLSHPNVASLFCYAEDDMECSIVMELMDCDLSEMMRNIMKGKSRGLGYPFSIIEAVNIMLQVGRGIEYLHEMKIVHRDLKAANILVRRVDGRDGENKNILAKVADFRLSGTKEKSFAYSMQTFNVGTTRWMAPEVIKMRQTELQEVVSNDTMVLKYPYRIDVYSFGMVCYEILTGRVPYFEVESLIEIKKKILNGDRPELPQHCPAELKDLIMRCWNQDASKRPQFNEICAKLRILRFELLMPDMQQRTCPQAAIRVHDKARIVVGLDFGTTFSGYAFAHKSNPEDIRTFYDWPGLMKPCYKTLTAIYYEPGDATTTKVKSWGFPALHDSTKDINNSMQKLRARAKSAMDLPEIGTYLARFKLHLGSKDAGESSIAKLPKGFTVTQVIADYLREIGASIMRHLRTTFSDALTMADVQWCVTVPSIWDDHAKKQMQVCMARAGLVRSANSPEGSPHPLSIVLEPEAASCYCHRNMPDLDLKIGDRLLVADIGGGTTDIVVQEWISETPDDYRVKEVTYSTSGLCGGTYVDEQFNMFLLAKIQCLPQFLRKTTTFMREIFKPWEDIKCRFGDLVTIGESFHLQLPSRLSAEWEEFDEEHGNPPRYSYDELELTHADLMAIFDPFVELVLGLIADQISRTTNVKVIFVVGGLAGLPYLMTRIRERFLGTVEKVISPVHPGAAVCMGAVMLALDQIS